MKESAKYQSFARESIKARKNMEVLKPKILNKGR